MHVAPTRGIRLRDTRQIGNWIVAALVLAIVAVALLVWWFSDASPRRGAGSGSAAVSPAAEQPQAAAPVDTAVPGPSPGRGAGAPDTGAPTTRGDAAAVAERLADDADATGPVDGPAERSAAGAVAPAVQPVPVPATDPARPLGAPPQSAADVPAGADAGAARPIGAGAGAAEAGTDAGPEAGSATATGAIRVEIRFSDECWVEITDAIGTRIYFGLAQAGDVEVLSGVPPLDVFLGNADAAGILVDGGEFAVPGEARRGNLARFAIEAD